jgi:hypothetical protein
MKRILLLVIFVLMFSVVSTAFAAPYWTVTSVNSIGCNSSATQFTTEVSGITSFPNTLLFHTIVDAGGLRYMDEYIGAIDSNGIYLWALHNSSTGGPTTATFPIAPDTPVTVQFLLIDGVGGPTVSSYVLHLTKCNGGVVFFPEAAGGCIAIPDGSVVGKFTESALMYAEPSVPTGPEIFLSPGESAWVIGVDESGEFYKIIWACEYRWVRVGTMGPNYDGVWNGRPLPTGTVS